MEQYHSAFYVITALCLVILVSDRLAKTQYGKGLGAALIAIILGALLANIGIIPSASNSIPLYDTIFHYAAPMAIFFLTLGVNLSKIKQAGLPMLLLFVLGSVATVVGVFLATFFIDMQSVLGEMSGPIAGMIAGTYTGGGINFNAIALHYKVQESGVLFAGTVAADNVMTTLWVLVTLSAPKLLQLVWPSNMPTGSKTHVACSSPEQDDNETTSLSNFIVLIPTALIAFIVAEVLASLIPIIPSILILTTIGLGLAQTRYFSELSGSHLLGLYLVYLFLAVVGAYCEVSAINNLGEIGLVLLLFVSSVVLIHGLITFSVGRLLVNDWQMIAIASQANVGGSTTAIAMAETFGRKELIVPAILIGTIGNALGTYIGFMVVGLL